VKALWKQHKMLMWWGRGGQWRGCRSKGGVLKKSAELCTFCDLAWGWGISLHGRAHFPSRLLNVCVDAAELVGLRLLQRNLMSSVDGFGSRTRRVQLDLD
jgi:hypothetical protein